MQYNDLINDIVPDCPGVPVPIALRAIREAVRKFCKESTAYRKRLSASDLSYSNGVYTITVPHGAQIETVISPMVFDGSYTVGDEFYKIQQTNVKGASPEWMDINRPGWRTAEKFNIVDHFVMLSSNTFVLTPDSGTDRSENLSISLVLIPNRSSETIDNEFGNRWFDELVAGAKYLLMVMPDAEWTNPKLAEFYHNKFEVGIEEAKRYIKTGFRHSQADGVNHVRMHYK
ncbi:MAG: hypothetical protein ACXV8O_01345 [Methylobacter sp.]